MRYIALLRGVNINGKNKISMPALKMAFIESGYQQVVTYLNSGNVVFSSEIDNESILIHKIHSLIQQSFTLDIPVLVISQDTLINLFSRAPVWWGSDDKSWYDNLIFTLPSADLNDLIKKIGPPSPELEQIFIDDSVVFWTFDRKQYAKANWWKKTASAGIGEHLTIRSAGTVNKLTTL